MRRPLAIILTLVALALIGGLPSAEAGSEPTGRYIVVLRDSTSRARTVATEQSRTHHTQVTAVYESALKGYAARMTASQANSLRADGRVVSVEADTAVSIAATQPSPPSWGLDRIDQRTLPLSSSFSATATGAGVTAYIIDTGIDTGIADFEGRASFAADFTGGGAVDCNGHGTHVAGTVGSETYGVAKAVNLVGVKVLDCNGSGYISWVVSGIDWVTAHAVKPAVANMSLGGGISTSLDAAVRRAISSGVTFAVAAGNNGADACNGSPSRVTEALVVAASDITDAKASFSNFGRCVDWFAPGVAITSVTPGGTPASWSGTSMASPHTAGVAALYLQSHRTATPASVSSALHASATKNAVKNPGKRTPNELLFTNGL